ncbi:ATP-binding cassette domain-containing protein [Actinomadura terrae]|uniref:ATP-binding cassette domain-containing protein n=1 Tax=Actinomadura terrae TaxID=604353 RepID=UPI001FA7A051|nr:ATP-binding cassette domain-containing protein [Actinomadura terrae]
MGVRRGGRWLLRPVSFGVPEGVVGVAGPPGVGKSTLLATFATLRRPHTGALHILGHDTAHAAGLRAARARIGYLPGGLSRKQHMTAGEFVSYAAYYQRVGASAARDVIGRLDLAEAAGTELCLLPPDVRLRAGVAAACVHSPGIVLLDDPFAELRAPGAEPGNGAAAVAELIPVLRSLAPTVVVTADAAATLTGWCDLLLGLSRGRLTALSTRTAARTPARPAARPASRPAAQPAVRPVPQARDAPAPAAVEEAARRRRPRPVPAQLTRFRAPRAPAGSGAGV